jgi:hypothetical protein
MDGINEVIALDPPRQLADTRPTRQRNVRTVVESERIVRTVEPHQDNLSFVTSVVDAVEAISRSQVGFFEYHFRFPLRAHPPEWRTNGRFRVVWCSEVAASECVLIITKNRPSPSFLHQISGLISTQTRDPPRPSENRRGRRLEPSPLPLLIHQTPLHSDKHPSLVR